MASASDDSVGGYRASDFVRVFPDEKANLGVGAFAEVTLCIHVPRGKPVAIKTERNDARITSRTLQSQPIMENIGNVIQCYGFFLHDMFVSYVLEYMDGLSLEYHICHKGFSGLPLDVIKAILLQVTNGLHNIHSRSVVHRDIRPANILLNMHGEVKVTDFNTARLLGVGSWGSTCQGHYSYMPPEILRAPHKHGLNADVWSLGMTTYYLACGVNPIPNSAASAEMAQDDGVPFLDARIYDENLCDFVRGCLTDSTIRPTSDRLLKHPLFAGMTIEGAMETVRDWLVNGLGYKPRQLPSVDEDAQ